VGRFLGFEELELSADDDDFDVAGLVAGGLDGLHLHDGAGALELGFDLELTVALEFGGLGFVATDLVFDGRARREGRDFALTPLRSRGTAP
jgi:hypothetical protein